MPSGHYQARYRAPDRKQRSKTFALRRDAVAWREANLAEMRRGSWLDPQAGKVKFAVFAVFAVFAESAAAAWLDLRPSTRSRNESYLKIYILPTFGDVDVSAIRPSDVQAWVAGLSASLGVEKWVRGLADANRVPDGTIDPLAVTERMPHSVAMTVTAATILVTANLPRRVPDAFEEQSRGRFARWRSRRAASGGG